MSHNREKVYHLNGIDLSLSKKIKLEGGRGVYKARSDKNIYIFKTYTEERAYSREKEAVNALSKKLDFIPKIISDGRFNNNYYIVFTYIEGKHFNELKVSKENKNKMMHSFGQRLGMIHVALSKKEIKSLKQYKIASLKDDKNQNWPIYLRKKIRGWVDAIRPETFDEYPGLRDKIIQKQSLLRRIATDSYSLIHCDYTPRNALFNKKTYQVCGVLDFETYMVGDPEYDLAKIFMVNGISKGILREFKEGWSSITGKVISESKMKLYIDINCISAIGWSDRQSEVKKHARFKEAAIRRLLIDEYA